MPVRENGLTFPLVDHSVVKDELLSAAPWSSSVPMVAPYLMMYKFSEGDTEVWRVRVDVNV